MLALGLVQKIGGAIALGLIIGLFMAFRVEQGRANRAQAKVVKLEAALQAISSKKAEQQIVTRDRIVYVERAERDAGRIAERIERAPVVPGKCQTPEAVRSADL